MDVARARWRAWWLEAGTLAVGDQSCDLGISRLKRMNLSVRAKAIYVRTKPEYPRRCRLDGVRRILEVLGAIWIVDYHPKAAHNLDGIAVPIREADRFAWYPVEVSDNRNRGQSRRVAFPNDSVVVEMPVLERVGTKIRPGTHYFFVPLWWFLREGIEALDHRTATNKDVTEAVCIEVPPAR